jgi:hypothetical protein
MKTALLLILTIFFSACSNKTELDNIVDPDMKATLRDYINSPNEFPVYFYTVDYSLRYPENKVLLDSTTNKQMSFDIPYLVANNKRYDIRKIWGMREAQKEIKPTKIITTELKIEFMK